MKLLVSHNTTPTTMNAGRNLKADQLQQNEWVTGQTSDHPRLRGIAFTEPAANDPPHCVKRKGKQIEMLAERILKRARQRERNVDTDPKAFQEAHSQTTAEGSGQRVLFCPDWDIKVDNEALSNAEVSWKLIQGMVLPKDRERLSEKWANIDSVDGAMFTIAKLSYESTANMGFMLVHLNRKIAEEKRRVKEAETRAKEAEERSHEAEKRTQKAEEKLAVVASEKKKLEEQHISLEDANQQLQAQVQDLNTKLTKYRVNVERIATKVIAWEEALRSKAEQLQKRVEEVEGEAEQQREAIHRLKTGAVIPKAVRNKIFNEIMMSQDWKDAQADIAEGTANMLKS